MMMTDKHRN